MLFSASGFYDRIIIQKPVMTLFVIGLIVFVFSIYAPQVRLDASADTLVLEGDQSLKYYRGIKARYGSDDYLVVTYTPQGELFAAPVLADLKKLRNELAEIVAVESVISILDVPLIDSPRVTLGQLQEEIRTLETPDMDARLARNEFLHSPLYKDMLLSGDARTTALQINIVRDDDYYRLRNQRDELRELQLVDALTPGQQLELDRASEQFYQYTASLQEQQAQLIIDVRSILDRHSDLAELHLGGIPMITADSIDFIAHDLVTFGVGVLVFIIVILAIAFGTLRWVVLPMITCFAAGSIMLGALAMASWPITVVSANFVSLMLIITLSLTIHLIVRYQELHAENPHAQQRWLVLTTLQKKLVPCFYTTITTMVAFGSLLVSSIRPLIDFGWMMVIGLAVAFVLSFTLFPATLMLLKPSKPVSHKDFTGAATRFIAAAIESYPVTGLSAYLLLLFVSIAGITTLTVENRFIDYFKESTEIYQGMELIDKQLGGTTPLDIVIDAPAEFFQQAGDEDEDDEGFLDELDLDDDLFDDDLAEESGITGSSYWFNVDKLPDVDAIHEYLDGLGETGKVLSISSTMAMLESLDPDIVSDDFLLAVLYKKLPDELKHDLIKPYLSDDGNQLRFSIRVFESDVNLQRNKLLATIKKDLTEKHDLHEDQVNLTGMVVLYNNMLQSLFKSQILTIGVVFLAILLMFIVLFRNFKLAFIALVTNMVPAAMVLGLMGLIAIPLDLMTITIAAICIGIAVDDSIHYVDRFNTEFDQSSDYWASVKRCHDSIGRAMYYTSITITLGFSILVLSNFVPTLYFGLLTGFAMLVALLANLTLLPLLIVRFKPRG